MIYDLFSDDIEGDRYKAEQDVAVILSSDQPSDWRNLKYLSMPKVLQKFKEDFQGSLPKPNYENALAIQVQHDGYDKYSSIVSQLCSDFNNLILVLKQNPFCVMHKEMFHLYRGKMSEVIQDFHDKKKCFSASHWTLINFVITKIKEAGQKWIKLESYYKIPEKVEQNLNYTNLRK